jgi:hypothetical protein
MPGGVPVEMISPGRGVITAEMKADELSPATDQMAQRAVSSIRLDGSLAFGGVAVSTATTAYT